MAYFNVLLMSVTDKVLIKKLPEISGSFLVSRTKPKFFFEELAARKKLLNSFIPGFSIFRLLLGLLE